MSRFPYYARLGKKRQAIYRRSDAIVEVPLEEPEGTAPALEAIEAGLAGDDRRGDNRRRTGPECAHAP